MIVYLLLNQLNGKGYVGQHRGYKLSKRWNSNLNNTKTNAHLQAAVRKYGPDSFTRTVLAHASCQGELDLLEKFFITIFQTCNPRHGYNLQTGGLTGAGRHSAETIQRIREANKRHWEKKKPEELILLAENARLRWDLWSDERKRRWAEDCRQRWWTRTPEDRHRIIELVREHTVGKKRSVPGWNKGLLGWNAGQQKSLATRQKLSAALKLYWAQKRQLPPKKPCTGTRSQCSPQTPREPKETRATAALKEVELAKRQLREIKERLDTLTFELEGGCSW